MERRRDRTRQSRLCRVHPARMYNNATLLIPVRAITLSFRRALCIICVIFVLIYLYFISLRRCIFTNSSYLYVCTHP